MQATAQLAQATAQLTKIFALPDRDRLGLALVVASAVHLLLLIGLGFDTEPRPRISKTLEVTLAQFRSERAPDQADFIAQHNQIGSGAAEAKHLPSTTEHSLFQANQSQPLAAQQHAAPPSDQLPNPSVPSQPDASQRLSTELRKASDAQSAKLHTLNQRAPDQVAIEQASTPSSIQPTSGQAASLRATSLEIASLQAKLDWQTQHQARMPRVRRLYSASTQAAEDAAYLEAWRRKIERVGNLNYPAEARRRGLYGNLRLLVAINPDGSLKSVEVLKSSGHRMLDNAAVRIVRQAAPFAPFPNKLRDQTDVLEIIRTWKFERNYRLSGG